MPDLYHHPHRVTPADRSRIMGHRPAVIWMTGLSGSGKSTLANQLEYELNHRYSVHTYLLDGDNIRHGINRDLGFSEADREENIRRIGQVCRYMVEAGLVVITALISPYRRSRDRVREWFPDGEFIEVYVECPLEVCESRDPKGIYRKARAGRIPQFTGIDSDYQPPLQPEIRINTDQSSISESTESILRYLIESYSLIRSS
ncbi:MAG: adenylyl-sulfate kinase [Candidatus Delongbacteria bacterium]|nr:adenylyl-sulfate kinase [Candidatus Delongbacteria bacterium]